jgi:hypothetical protein
MLLASVGARREALALLPLAQPRGLVLRDIMRFPGFDNIREDPVFVRIWNEAGPPGVSR